MRAGPMRAGPMRAGPMWAGPMRASPMRASPMRASPMRASPRALATTTTTTTRVEDDGARPKAEDVGRLELRTAVTTATVGKTDGPTLALALSCPVLASPFQPRPRSPFLPCLPSPIPAPSSLALSCPVFPRPFLPCPRPPFVAHPPLTARHSRCRRTWRWRGTTSTAARACRSSSSGQRWTPSCARSQAGRTSSGAPATSASNVRTLGPSF